MSITFTWNNPNTSEYTPEYTCIYRSDEQFDTDNLPPIFETLPGASTSYIDDTATDGETYYYRVSFKLGVREEFSRLIEIKAPTAPDLFESAILSSVFQYSRQVTNNAGQSYGDQCVVVDNWLDFKWARAIGSNALFGRWAERGYKTSASMIVRLACMVAIQKFRRSVWLTEGFTVQNYATLYPADSTGSSTGWFASANSGIPAGSSMTWREAFNLVARAHCSMDICLNILNELRADILQSLTYTRGRTVAEYGLTTAIAAFMRYIYQLGGAMCAMTPFRGTGSSLDNSAYPFVNSVSVENVTRDPENDPLALVRVFRAVMEEYPEIKAVMSIWDMGIGLTYTDSALATIDWLSAANNNRDKCDPMQGMHVPTTATGVGGQNMISARGRGLNGVTTFYPDTFGMMGCAGEQSSTTANNETTTGFYLTTTPNGKDFATLFTNGAFPSQALFDAGRIWNKASAICESYTDGLTNVDPLESQVVLRYIPHLGLVDQSPAGTLMSNPSGAAFTLANHYSAANATPGFPDQALAFRGGDSAGMATILTNLNLLEYIRAGTSFTIEAFTSNLWTSGQVINDSSMSFFELGNFTSGSRYTGLTFSGYNCHFVPRIHATHTDAGTITNTSGVFTKAFPDSTQANFNNFNGSRFFNHIVLQYDAINAVFEFFANGVLVRRWSTFTPTASLGACLSLFGCKNTSADVATQRHFAYTVNNGLTYMEHLIHEVVVTRAKRYNYACFVGKVPFSRKRFAA